MYHPILPFLPPGEVRRQIDLNEDYNERVIGSTYGNPKGFFPPEMAISKGVLDIVEQEGYKWILLSGIACPSEWPIDFYYTYKSLPVLFRDDIISNEISFKKFKSPKEFLKKLTTLFDDDYYVITAMDGETYGHHIKNYETEFLGVTITELESEEEVQMIHLDDILNLFKKRAEVIPIDSTWSTAPENLQNKNPYPLWAAPNNKLHTIQTHLRKLTLKLWGILRLIYLKSIQRK